MYVDADFVLALVKDDDWLSERAEEVYRENEDLWTSPYTLIELMLVAYREDRNVVRTVAETVELVEVKGSTDEVEAAAVYVQEEDLTPFDALHLVSSGDDAIASGDYDGFSERKGLEE
ncbi:MAG: type II toxin-antitoxin system VapC family toxin [Candidatus Nanohaloarchaea archaeon]